MTGEELQSWRKASAYKTRRALGMALDVNPRTIERWEHTAPPLLGVLAIRQLDMQSQWASIEPALLTMSHLFNPRQA